MDEFYITEEEFEEMEQAEREKHDEKVRELEKEEHEKLLNLPNWNNEVFKEITGIDAESEIAKE